MTSDPLAQCTIGLLVLLALWFFVEWLLNKLGGGKN